MVLEINTKQRPNKPDQLRLDMESKPFAVSCSKHGYATHSPRILWEEALIDIRHSRSKQTDQMPRYSSAHLHKETSQAFKTKPRAEIESPLMRNSFRLVLSQIATTPATELGEVLCCQTSSPVAHGPPWGRRKRGRRWGLIIHLYSCIQILPLF